VRFSDESYLHRESLPHAVTPFTSCETLICFDYLLHALASGSLLVFPESLMLKPQTHFPLAAALLEIFMSLAASSLTYLPFFVLAVGVHLCGLL